MPEKLLVTNRKALRTKYGTAGLKKIETRLQKLVRADKRRGVQTTLVAMDIQSEVASYAAPKIRDAASAEQTKRCIDALFTATQPDYLMILGAPDVVCHQDLNNPVFGDDDIDVPSDLPYACDAAYSQEIADFIGPTRVVGRLPDIAAASEPDALLDALDTAIAWQRRTRNSYNSCCAISAKSWKESTRKSIRKIFGKGGVQFVSPPAAPPWSKAELKPRMHFFNCHGLDFNTAFYGDDGAGWQPLVIDQADYEGRLRDGTVFAAECCYGAMLYEAPLLDMPPGICNTVLYNSAYGFLGSSNVAYGPATSNGYADLVCQYFMANVRNGASTGRALLEARQRYAQGEAPLDPVDLKTLGQFNLLGDPSVHPVKMLAATQRKVAARKSLATTMARRKTLSKKGAHIGRSIASVHSKAGGAINEKLRDVLLRELTREHYQNKSDIFSFDVRAARQPLLAKSNAARKKAAGGGRYHVVVASDARSQRPQPHAKAKKRAAGSSPDVLLLALEQGNEIQYTKTLYRR